MATFAITLDPQSAFSEAALIDASLEGSASGDARLRFELISDKLPEHVVCVRYSRGTIHTRVLRCQLQTNLGRCSVWFGQHSPVDGAEIFTEVYAEPAGSAIVGVKVRDGSGVTLSTAKAPSCKPLRRKSFLGTINQSLSLLKEEHGDRESVYKKATKSALRKKLPIMMPPLISSKPSLLRLLAQDAVPYSALEILTRRGKTYDSALMDLMVLHEPNESIASMACERSAVLKTSIAKACLKSPKGHHHQWSLARLMLTPNYARGDRSILQLLTDDEVFDDYERPSILRMLLFQEDQKQSLLRALLKKNPVLGTSISELLLQGEGSSHSASLVRIALEGNKTSGKLAKFLADSPFNGKPALAKYLFAGAKNSIARKVLYGEDEGRHSLLRLLVLRRPNKAARYGFDPCLAEVLATKHPSESSSLLDQMTQDSELGVNLARITFETTCRIKSGVLETFVQADRTPSLLENGSILSDTGCTLAHLFLAGEKENAFSFLRALTIGELSGSSPTEVTSVLRLMSEHAEDGKPSMLQIFLQQMLELFGNKKRSGKVTRKGSTPSAAPIAASGAATVQTTSKLSPQAFLPLILKLSNRLAQLGPDFAKRWRDSWDFVSEQVLKTVDEEKSQEWRRTAPLWSKICGLIGRRRWSRALIKFSQIARILDSGHGNRFMMTQRAVSNAAKAGVATGFGISKGIIKAVSSALPIPIASAALDGVHGVLGMAEAVTHTSIDVATKLSVEATGFAMKKSGKKGSSAMSRESEDLDDDEEDGDDDEEGEDDHIIRALSIAFGEDEEDDA